MGKGCVEGTVALPAATTVAARDQQGAVREIEEAVRFGPRIEVAGDNPPCIAAHGAGAFVPAADAEWHSLGGTAAELGMQQRIQLIPVSSGKCCVEGAGEVGRLAAFHSQNSLQTRSYQRCFGRHAGACGKSP